MELTVCFSVLVALAVAIDVGFSGGGGSGGVGSTIFGHGSSGGRVCGNCSIFGLAALFAIGSINCIT